MLDNNETAPSETQKQQTMIKVGIAASVLAIFVIYRIYLAFTGVDANTTQIKEEVKIFKNDDMVQTKFAHEITPEIKAQKADIYKIQKEMIEQKKLIEELKKQNDELMKSKEPELPNNITNSDNMQFPNFPIQQNVINDEPENTKRTIIKQNKEDSLIFDVEPLNTSPKEQALNTENKVESQNISSKNQIQTQTSSSDENKKVLILPPGAVIKARLISGVRAPTLTKAVNEPQPVLLKVTDLAMLPNHAKTNIKDCVIKGEAKGDLSTETVQIRTNFLSCTTNDGEVLVSQLFGTVTGGSGSNGIAGEVVSKQGALLGRSLIAGFVNGFANVANNQYQSTLTSTSGTLTTSNVNSTSDMAKSGAYGGLASAGNEMSKFYMDMVKQIEPSIEIKPNIDVDVIVTDTSKIEIKG